MYKFIVTKESIAKFKQEYETKIKKGGIYLKSKNNITEGDKVAVVFRMRTEKIDIETFGEVGWVDDDISPDGKRGFLVRGLVISPAGLEILNKYNTQTNSQFNTDTGYTQNPTNYTTGTGSYPTQPSPPPPPSSTHTPPPPPQQPPVQQQPSGYQQPVTPPPPQQPTQGQSGYYNNQQYQQPPQQNVPPPPPPPPSPPQPQNTGAVPPNTNISVNVTSPTQTPPPGYNSSMYEDDLKKLKGGKTGLYIFIIFLIILGGAAYWFFGMGGKELLMPKKEVKEVVQPKPEPPPPSEPQKVIVEVKEVAPKPEPKPEPPPKPKPKPKKKKRVIIRPGLKDFSYNTGANFTRIVFVFNRRFKKYIPSDTGTKLTVYIPNGYNDTDQDQFFLGSNLIRSVIVTKEMGTLALNFYPVNGVVPKYEFDREPDKLIVTFFKNAQ